MKNNPSRVINDLNEFINNNYFKICRNQLVVDNGVYIIANILTFILFMVFMFASKNILIPVPLMVMTFSFLYYIQKKKENRYKKTKRAIIDFIQKNGEKIEDTMVSGFEMLSKEEKKALSSATINYFIAVKTKNSPSDKISEEMFMDNYYMIKYAMKGLKEALIQKIKTEIEEDDEFY